MNFKEFQDAVVKDLPDRLPGEMQGVQMEIRHVDKLQNQSYTGLSLQTDDNPMAAGIKLDSFFKKMNAGEPYSSILNQIADEAKSVLSDMPRIDVDILENYEQMKATLYVQVIPTELNKDMLQNIPHREMEDLSVVYRMKLGQDETGTASVLMTNEIMGIYGITAEQLHKDAMENTALNQPPTLRNLADVMRELMGDMSAVFDFGAEEKPSMFVASVEGSVGGAGVIAYPDFMDQAAGQLGGDFFVLPSSVHEVLLLPDNGETNYRDLESMVREVNASEVLPEDKLSDNVYHYDSQDRVFELAEKFENRRQEREENNQERPSVLAELNHMRKESKQKDSKEPSVPKKHHEETL